MCVTRGRAYVRDAVIPSSESVGITGQGGSASAELLCETVIYNSATVKTRGNKH